MNHLPGHRHDCYCEDCLDYDSRIRKVADIKVDGDDHAKLDFIIDTLEELRERILHGR